MTRFETQRQKNPFKNMILSLILFAGIFFLFCTGISSLSRTSAREQQAALTRAVTESTVHYYALNGYYPESLSVLLKDYKITYDREHFLIDYQPQGKNLMPEITVLEKGR